MKNYLEEIGFVLVLLFLALLLVFSLFWALSIGTVKLPVREIYETVLAQFTSGEPITAPGQGSVHDIVWLLRLPRLILASLVGCGLAVCGVIMQAIVKNPLADPYILGISSGASLGATSAILLGIGVSLGPNFVGIAAFIGAFAISLAVLFISNLGGRSNSMKLLLAGMALSALTGAIFLVICDGLCRIIIPHTELPIGILISMIGAPSFIYLMIKKTYGFGGND